MRGGRISGGAKLREVTPNAKGCPYRAQFDRAYLRVERCNRQRVDKLIPEFPINGVSRQRPIERDVQCRIAAFDENMAGRPGAHYRRAAAKPGKVLGTCL